MIGLIILALLVITQIIIMCILSKYVMKYLRHLQKQCETDGFKCKNKSNWDLCKMVVDLGQSAKIDDLEPIFKDTCCGNPANNDTWMKSTATIEKDPKINNFEINCMDS